MAMVRFELQGSTGVVTLDNDKENRFHPDLVAQVLSTLDQAEKDKGIKALVFTGADPKFFCNGLDLPWLMAHATDMQSILAYLTQINAMYRRVCLFPKPIVGALNGHTFAGGAFLAAHMDFRFMRADKGWVCLPEVDINIPLLPGMVAIMQAVTTPAGFREMYYTGRRFTAQEAQAAGYVDRTFPAEELLPRSIDFAAELGAKRTRTYAEMKRRLRAHVVRVMDEEDAAAFLPTLALAMPG